MFTLASYHLTVMTAQHSKNGALSGGFAVQGGHLWLVRDSNVSVCWVPHPECRPNKNEEFWTCQGVPSTMQLADTWDAFMQHLGNGASAMVDKKGERCETPKSSHRSGPVPRLTHLVSILALIKHTHTCLSISMWTSATPSSAAELWLVARVDRIEYLAFNAGGPLDRKIFRQCFAVLGTQPMECPTRQITDKWHRGCCV
jgi:hypothetical protein